MIHTPETAREAAKTVLDQNVFAGLFDPNDMRDAITAALLKAQADALEEAAQLTADFDEEAPDDPPPEMRWWPQDAIAAAIRALIPKGAS